MPTNRRAKVDGRLMHRAVELRKQGMTQEAIAVELGVAQGTISIILRQLGLGGAMVSKNPPGKRDYQHEYAEYQGRPEQIKHREERNAARRQETKAGKSVAGKDVAHIRPLAGGGSNTAGNERVESAAKNRSWRKGQRGYAVPIDK